MERNYDAMQKFFDRAAYDKLIAVLAEKEKAGDERADKMFGGLKRGLKNCHEYVTTVDMTETQIHCAYARTSGEALRDIITAVDRLRHTSHEACIASVSLINNIAMACGTDPVFIGDVEDRLQVADFCLDVTVQLFETRRK